MMYGGNEFDGGAAAFMGGGFMPSQATQPSDPSLSVSKNREARCLFPLTVKQICDLASNDESNFIIDGAQVNNVTIVARVCHKENKASEYTFLLDDGTGQIECTRWVQESIDTDEMRDISIGIYVRVNGHLRGLQGRRFINVFSIRFRNSKLTLTSEVGRTTVANMMNTICWMPVTDFNEIPSHFIECIYVHFYNTRLRGVTSQPPVSNSTMNTPSKGFSAAPPNQASNYVDGLSNFAQRILDILQQPAFLANEDGAHRDVIARQLNLPMNKLMEELQTLVDNGFVYSTIDDDHFKSTVNG